jgi:parvulin-like peptidyl-prolyl isomerase
VLHGVASPELDKAAFSMEVGQNSDPILTEIGYNVIRVTEKRAAQAPDFEQFKDDLANFLGNVALHKKLESYVKGLRDKAVIERHLPPA